MSRAALGRISKRSRGLCVACLSRKAKFSYRGQVRADRDHTLCFACFRSLTDRTRHRIRLTRGLIGFNIRLSASAVIFAGCSERDRSFAPRSLP
jgi:hypothetical protein